MCTIENGTEDSSYDSTSFNLTSLVFAMTRRPNRFLSALTIITFSSADLAFVLLAYLANVFILRLGIGSHSFFSFVLSLCSTNAVICDFPDSYDFNNLAASSEGITTPVARLIRGAVSPSLKSSKLKGSVISSDVKSASKL